MSWPDLVRGLLSQSKLFNHGWREERQTHIVPRYSRFMFVHTGRRMVSVHLLSGFSEISESHEPRVSLIYHCATAKSLKVSKIFIKFFAWCCHNDSIIHQQLREKPFIILISVPTCSTSEERLCCSHARDLITLIISYCNKTSVSVYN